MTRSYPENSKNLSFPHAVSGNLDKGNRGCPFPPEADPPFVEEPCGHDNFGIGSNLMRHLAIIIFCSAYLFFASIACADNQAVQPSAEKINTEQGLLSTPPTKNPFKPQLPFVPKIKIEKPAPPVPMGPETLPQPVRLQTEVEVQLPALRIAGLIWNSDKPQAIINNTIVNIGDQIENVTIKDINKTGVVILYQEKEFTFPPPQ